MVAAIRFACGTCHAKLSVPARYAGRKGVCPNCRAVTRVPATVAVAQPPPQQPQGTPPPAKATPRAPSPPPRTPATAAAAPARAPVDSRPAAAPKPAPAPVVAAPPRAAASWPADEPAGGGRAPLAWLRRRLGASHDPDALVPLRREWAVDRGGLPMGLRLALLVGAVAGFVAILWGTIYGLLRLLVPIDG
jgi:hypothetical protein